MEERLEARGFHEAATLGRDCGRWEEGRRLTTTISLCPRTEVSFLSGYVPQATSIMGFISHLLVLSVWLSCQCGCLAYFADWSSLAQDREPLCVDIPRNLTLCHDIGYTKMRLPNLLDHDTMQEVSQQASSWIPLLNIKCHADTKLFLCSLFAPVCLERPIYPCR